MRISSLMRGSTMALYLCFALMYQLGAGETLKDPPDSNSATKLDKRMNHEDATLDEWNPIHSTTQSTSSSSSDSPTKPKRTAGRHLKYPSVLGLIQSIPSDQVNLPANVKLKHREGAILASRNGKEVSVSLPLHCPTSSNEAGSRQGEVIYGPENLGRYALLRLRAEREGRLEQFQKAYRERMARRRAGQGAEDKKKLSKYDYTTRKMNLEALKVLDPLLAQQKEEAIKARAREASRKHYHRNIEKERERQRVKWKTYTEALKGIHMHDDADIAPSQRVQLEFDLNEPALMEEESDEGEINMMRRGLTNEASSSKPSARKVKHPELLTILDKITTQPKNSKKVANSQMEVDPITGKLMVRLRDVDDAIELDTTTAKIPKEKKKITGPVKESSYHRRLREAAEEGPEALANLRKHFRDLNYKARQRQIEAGVEDKTDYYRYVNLVRKKNQALLERTNPELAEEKKRALKRISREAQKRYRKRVREGLPIKQYRQCDEEGGSTSMEDGELRSEFELMNLDSDWHESSSSGYFDDFTWGQRGRRTERMVMEDPVELQWGGSGGRRDRDGRNTTWLSADVGPLEPVQQDDHDAAMIKWRSIADSILSNSRHQYEAKEQFVSQLPFGHIPYQQMTKYQQKWYRAEQRGELEKLKQKKKEWQAAYVNRAIEKEKKRMITSSNQGITPAEKSNEAGDESKMTFYKIRRRRMKEKGLLDEFYEKKRDYMNRSRSMRQFNNEDESAEKTMSESSTSEDAAKDKVEGGVPDDASKELRGFDLNLPASEED